MPFVNVIADLRQLARNFAIETKNKEILKVKIRDFFYFFLLLLLRIHFIIKVSTRKIF